MSLERSPRESSPPGAAVQPKRRKSILISEDAAKDEEEEWIKGVCADEVDLSLTKVDQLHIALLFVLPGALALSPLLLPFGNPFCKDGDNSIATNWAYYFWYNPLGWGVMWAKIVLWNCELWGVDFFLPFMHARGGFCLFNGPLAAVVGTTIFSTMFYCCGYLIFHNPVPIGTVTFGVPCFVVLFIHIYFLVVPVRYRTTLHDHVRILRCWAPFLIWISGLVVCICIIWAQTYLLPQIETSYLFILGNVATALALIVIREVLASLPLDWFLGVENFDLAVLWTLGYSAMCSAMSDWIFPGMPTDAAGLISSATVIFVNLALSWIQFENATRVSTVIHSFLNNACDVISGMAFLVVFVYNAFGPNQQAVYIVADLSTEQQVQAVEMILVNLGINVVKLLLMFRIAGNRYTPEIHRNLKLCSVVALRRWYWLVVLLLVSTCCACGACMVMMHDGMDFSFSFSQWSGTWPFIDEHSAVERGHRRLR